jgi:hypothetical protein
MRFGLETHHESLLKIKKRLHSGAAFIKEAVGREISGKAMHEDIPRSRMFKQDKSNSQEEGCNQSFLASFVT